MSKERPHVDKEFQEFLDEKERQQDWIERADFRLRNAFRACEKAMEAILHHPDGYDEGRLQTIEKNLEYIVNNNLFDPTRREIDCLFDLFYSVLGKKKGDAVLRTGALDQADFTLEGAYKLLEKMSGWSGSRARREENPEK